MIEKQKNIHKHPVVRVAHAVHRHAKDHFVPHEGNGHSPHVLKHHVLFGYSSILLLLKILVIAVPIALPAFNVFSSAITPKNIVDLTNTERAKLKVGPVITNDRLAKAAQAKAEDMLAKHYFSHIGPDGGMPWEWIKKSGYVYDAAAENLAIHFTQAEDVESGWLASPSHRTNLINPKYTEIGVGVSEGMFHGYPSIVVVQMFGQPKDKAVKDKNPVQPVLTKKTETVPTPAKIIKTAAETNTESGQVAGIATESTDKNDGTPIINETEAVILPSDKKITVQIPIKDASQAYANLGTRRKSLARLDSSDVWEGTLSYDPTADSEGNELSVTALGTSGKKTTTALAVILSKAEMRDVFVPDAKTQGCFLLRWISDGRMNLAANCTYVFAIIFLSASLLIALLMKERALKPSIVAHGMLVIGLAFLLWKF